MKTQVQTRVRALARIKKFSADQDTLTDTPMEIIEREVFLSEDEAKSLLGQGTSARNAAE